MNRIIIIVIVAVIVADIFVEETLLWGYSYYLHLLWWFPTVAAIAGALISKLCHIVNGRYFAKGVLLSVEIPKVFFATCSMLGILFSPLVPKASFIGNGLGVLLGLSLSIAAMYGMLLGWKRLKVVEVSLEFESLPVEFDGYRIVQLSDLHLGSLSKNSKFLDDVIRNTNTLSADTIVFTGDLVNFSTKEAKPFVPLLSTLKAPDGIIAVLGNHDYPKYGSTEHIQEEGRCLAEMERQLGWQVLLNESYTIKRGEARLVFVGMDDSAGRQLSEKDCLRVAMEHIPKEDFTILLSHRPNIWRNIVLEGTSIPLTLAGHTHAGQLRLGNWSPAKADYAEWCGIYQQGIQKLYVNQGTGTKFRFRLGTHAEITLITLHRSQSDVLIF